MINEGLRYAEVESKSSHRLIKEGCIPLKFRVKKRDLQGSKFEIRNHLTIMHQTEKGRNNDNFKKKERPTALIVKAARDPNPTREFILGDPFLKALRPSKSKSTTN